MKIKQLLPSRFILTCKHFFKRQYLHWLRWTLSIGHDRSNTLIVSCSLLFISMTFVCCDWRQVYFLN